MHEGVVLREAGRLSLDVETTGKGKDLQRVLFYNFLPGKPDPEIDRQERRWRESLGLDPKVKHFRVVFGTGRGGPGEIRVVTRSIMAILIDVARGVQVPASDIAEGLYDGDANRLPPRRPHRHPIEHRGAASERCCHLCSLS